MNQSFIEAVGRVTNITDSLNMWVENMTVSSLEAFLDKDMTSTTSIANNIATELNKTQPDFFFQVIVAKRDNELNDNFLVRGGCNKRTRKSVRPSEIGQAIFGSTTSETWIFRSGTG